jgi:1-acyl-sn-glycerol-3-phosphate acyltransferase
MPQPRELPMISGVTLRLFRRVVRRYFRRHFRAVMVQQVEMLSEARGPLIVYANHSSWWDPMVSVLLAEVALPGRRHYAPMDAEALQRYPILKRIGLFPVEMSSARGAAMFLRTSQAILEAGGVLWITPQGKFADAREALVFKPGLGALAARVPEMTLVPLAIEYAFWDERMPETLLRLGKPIRVSEGVGHEGATAELQAALAAVMAELKVSAMARDAAAFEPLLSGQRGTGGVYGWARRVRAWVSGRPAQADHTRRDDGKQDAL